jgi:hypothetical protein
VIEGKPQACIALLPLWLKLRDLAERYTSTAQFGSPLIRIKSMPDTPLSRRFSGSLNRRSQAQLASDLVSLVRFLRTFLQRNQNGQRI